MKAPAALRPAQPSEGGYRMVNRGNGRGEIYLYGTIGDSFWSEGISAKKFADDLKALGKVDAIDLRINSEGGDVFAAKAMYSLLVDHPAEVTTHIDGLAASAASYVAMAGNKIKIAEAAFLMIHNASTIVRGNAKEMRRKADLIETVDASIREVYAARTGQDLAQIRDWMNEETWFEGEEAVDAGFADTLVENLKVAASVADPAVFKHLPSALQPNRMRARAIMESLRGAAA